MSTRRQDDRHAPEAAAEAREWSGVATNADPHALDAGKAVDARNVASIRPGELRVRGGAAFLAFDP